jgi:hypothetical protein
MRAHIAATLILAAALLSVAGVAQAQTGTGTGADRLNCNAATSDGGTLADDASSVPSATQADSGFTDVPAPTTYRDAADMSTEAYRDQRCKVLDYIEKPLLQEEWNSIPPPPSPVLATIPLDASNDIDKAAVKRGYGWCNYVSDSDKTAYYSGIYQGVPSEMALDPIVVDKTLKTMSQDFEKIVQKLYPGEQGLSQCQFSQWDNKYVQEDQEKQSEFHNILQNYKIVRTDWQPQLTSTQ